jgi:hypothetical protein
MEMRYFCHWLGIANDWASEIETAGGDNTGAITGFHW